jgi:adenylate kinase
MNGLILISGVNYSGKSTIAQIIREKFLELNILEAKFLTASVEMMEYSRINSHTDLMKMNPVSREKVRQEVFSRIVEDSKRSPIFLDCHFAFENGEKPDFSNFCNDVKAIVIVKPDPETIIYRAKTDGSIQHPGRQLMTDLDFIKRYIGCDEEAVKDFIERTHNTVGFRPGLLVIQNNFTDLRSLREEVLSIIPRIIEYLTINNLDLEGRPAGFRK